MHKNNLGMVLGVVLLVIVAAVVLLSGKNEQVQVASDKVQVVASFYPLYFFASEIGGDKAEVKNITPAGAEPHEYEPTAQDFASIQNSNLLVLNGGGLEPWGEDVASNINSDNTLVINAGVELMNQRVMEDGEDIIDPHVWLSPQLAGKMADKIAQGFMRIDPLNAEYYGANATTLKIKLVNLDEEYKLGLKNCSQSNIITSHVAFGYLAAAYGFKQVAITGVSPDAEPSAKELGEVAKFAKNNNVKYIFFESLVSPKLAETIAREVGAQTLVLNPLEGLTDEEVASGADYLTEMRSNLANLKIALECK